MRPTILVVEDEETVAELIAFAFRRAGFDVTVLRDGRAASEHVATAPPPQAVVLDVMLPCRDGYVVASTIRQDGRWRNVPIVMISAAPRDRHAARSNVIEVDAYIEKPFRPTALVQAVKSLLARASAA